MKTRSTTSHGRVDCVATKRGGTIFRGCLRAGEVATATSSLPIRQ